MEHDQGVAVYTRMAQAMAGSVDAFLAETLSSVEESMQAVQAIGDLPESLRRPVMISYSLDGNGDFRSGENVCEGIPRLLDFVDQHEVEGTCVDVCLCIYDWNGDAKVKRMYVLTKVLFIYPRG
jgi:hypothetical protein